MTQDNRTDIYHDLHQGQLSRQEQDTHRSASTILQMLREYLTPASLLDVGCGLGIWLKAASEMGINDVLGLEGPWIKDANLAVAPELIKECDLEKPFSLGRRFDVIVCSEVAEHLSETSSADFINSLVSHSDYILFSAAVPYQGGHHHVNEQFLHYWVAHFARHEFAVVDVFRPKIWDDSKILWWLRQNLVLFVRQTTAERNPSLRQELKVNRPISVVHPAVYYERVTSRTKKLIEQAKWIQDNEQVLSVLRSGGNFQITPGDGNRITITRIW